MNHACGIDDVPLGEGRAVTIDGRRIALFRTAAGWYAIDHRCPHAGGPLADGLTRGRCRSSSSRSPLAYFAWDRKKLRQEGPEAGG